MRIAVLAVATLVTVAGCATGNDDPSLPRSVTTATGSQADPDDPAA